MPTFTLTRPDDPAATRLLDDYFAYRAAGFTTHAAGYRVSRPDPAAFTPPLGVFLVAWDGDAALGCGGVRRIDDLGGKTTFEIKHLWVDEAARGRGWSRLLLGALEERALAFGAEWFVLDTNESLAAAQHLYRSSGYVSIPPYNDNPNATNWFGKPALGGPAVARGAEAQDERADDLEDEQ